MGMTLSVDLGYGFNIPIEEDGQVLSLYDEENEEFDSYDFSEEFDKKYPTLHLEYGYSMDYYTGAVVFVKRLQSYGYYEPAALDPSEFLLTDEEIDQLVRAASELKVDLKLEVIALPSYG